MLYDHVERGHSEELAAKGCTHLALMAPYVTPEGDLVARLSSSNRWGHAEPHPFTTQVMSAELSSSVRGVHSHLQGRAGLQHHCMIRDPPNPEAVFICCNFEGSIQPQILFFMDKCLTFEMQ